MFFVARCANLIQTREEADAVDRSSLTPTATNRPTSRRSFDTRTSSSSRSLRYGHSFVVLLFAELRLARSSTMRTRPTWCPT